MHNKEQSLRERDQNITNNWYIACLSHELSKTSPHSVLIYDKSYVLFRDEESKSVCLLNRCIHRATQLDSGTIKDGKISCPYHGWTYDKTGSVVNIPSEKPGSVPAKHLCSKPIPSHEQDGVIWVWMGQGTDPTAPPTWRFPHYEDSKWAKYFMITDFENEVVHLCENFMDVPHTVYVHKGWFRSKAATKVPMTVKSSDGKVLVTYDQVDDKIGGIFHWLLNPKGKSMKHTDEYTYPNITKVDYTFGDQYGFIINSQNTPVSNLKTKTYTYIAFRLALANTLIKPFISFYTRQVIEQDVDIMTNQGASFAIDPSTQFRSTDADELHIAIERLRHFGLESDEKVFSYADLKVKDFWI
jgi:phenylpropionate dioxygenase-like ring-hydroxylating dioxygenase large terminal subunit